MFSQLLALVLVGNADDLKAAKYQVSQIGDLKYPMIRKVWEDNELDE